MAKARPRYICKGNVSLNGVSIKGQKFIHVRDCNWKGKKTAKKWMKYGVMRFNDKTWVRDNDLVIFYERVISKKDIERLYELADESK